MSVRLSWLPSTDADIASYDIERSASVGGPWTFLANVLHVLPGPNWDADKEEFFYNDSAGTSSSYYRIVAIDQLNQRSPASAPFRVSDALAVGPPSLVNTLDIVVGAVGAMLSLGFSTIEVWGSDDAGGTWVELTAGSPVPAGKQSRPQLVDGATIYSFYDVGAPSFRRYKWRFSANGANPLSVFSQNTNGLPAPLAGLQMSIGMARFVSVDGRPCRRSVIVAAETGQMAAGALLGSKDSLVFESDENGFLQIPLIQKTIIRVAFEGTDIIRTITVPEAPAFDLMAAVAEADDGFTVQTLPPLLTKRSL